MKAIRAIPAILGLGLMTACSTPGDLVTRTVAPDGPLFQASSPYEAHGVMVRTSYSVSEVNVSVPNVLTVSEANTYKPRADIVWREDPLGNRHQQVATLVQNAIVDGVTGMEGERDVVLQVQITKFHALTERTRYSVGGTHDIHFALTVLDAKTGAVVEPMRLIETELTAFGGRMAIEAERQGQTQKVRISAHLKNLIHQELTAPREIVVAERAR